MEACFCEPEKEVPGACVSGSHLQPFYAQWLLLGILAFNMITHADKNPKLPFLHDEAQKDKYVSLQTQTIPQPLTENNVENFIYVSSTEQNNKYNCNSM